MAAIGTGRATEKDEFLLCVKCENTMAYAHAEIISEPCHAHHREGRLESFFPVCTFAASYASEAIRLRAFAVYQWYGG